MDELDRLVLKLRQVPVEQVKVFGEDIHNRPRTREEITEVLGAQGWTIDEYVAADSVYYKTSGVQRPPFSILNLLRLRPFVTK